MFRDQTKEEKEQYAKELVLLTKEIESKYPKEVIVPDRLINPDPLVKEAQIDLQSKESRREHRTGVKYAIRNSSGQLSIEVTPRNVDRSLRFMNAFIILARKRGHEVKISQGSTLIIVDGEKYGIRLREVYKKMIFMEGDRTSSDFVPTGFLSLKIVESYGKTEWKGSKTTPIEKQLAKIMAALELRAKYDKIRQAEIEAYWVEENKRRAIEKRKQAEREWEEKKSDVLLQHVEKWNQSQKLQSFIQKVESMIDNEPNKKTKEWIQWAKKQLKELDPLSEGIDALMSKYDFKEEQPDT